MQYNPASVCQPTSNLGLAARRGYPPSHIPSLQQMCQTPNGSMGIVNGSDIGSPAMIGDAMKKIPAIPALVKDGEPI